MAAGLPRCRVVATEAGRVVSIGEKEIRPWTWLEFRYAVHRYST